MINIQQTKINFTYNLVNLLTTVAIGLIYTPYLVKSLGIVAYGLVPLSVIITQYIHVITGSLTGSLTRFYTVALQQNNTVKASEYLSSSLLAITGIMAVMSPFLLLLIFKIDIVFNIPVHFLGQARQLFICTILGFVLSVYSSQLNVTLYALNRLDLINRIKIIRYVMRVFLVVVFFQTLSKNVASIGYAFFVAESAGLFLSVLFFNRATAGSVKLSVGHFGKSALFGMLSMMLWVIVHQLGDTGLNRIDILMVNRFWTIRESGILGAVSQFGSYVMLITTVFSSLFGPLIMIAFGNEDHAGVKKLALQNALFVGLLTAVMVGLLCGFSRPIIRFWLGPEYMGYSHWFILKQVTLPFFAAAGVLAIVSRAWNRIIIPAALTLLLGVLNLGAAWIICAASHGSESYILIILLAASLFILIQSFGLNAYNFTRIYPEVQKSKLMFIFLKILAALLFTALFAFGYTWLFNITAIIELLVGLSLVTMVVATSGFFIFLSRGQRQMILRYLLKNGPIK